MRCDDIRDDLSAYLDGMLDETSERHVAAHLQDCAACRKEYQTLSELVSRLSSLPKVPAPTDLLENILKEKSRKPWFESVYKTLFIPFRIKIPLELATGLLTVLLVFFLFHTQQKGDDETRALMELDAPTGITQAVPKGGIPKAAPEATEAPPRAMPEPPSNALRRSVAPPKMASENRPAVPTHIGVADSKFTDTMPEPSRSIVLYLGQKRTMREAPAQLTEKRAIEADKSDDSAYSFETEHALALIRKFLIDLGGEISATQPLQTPSRGVTLHGSIPVAGYPSLLEKLSQLGRFQPQGGPPAPETTVDPVPITITLMTGDVSHNR